MSRPSRYVLLLVLACLWNSAAFSQSVALWRSQSALRGTWREETHIEVSGMTLKVGSGELAIGGTGAFGFMEIVERELGSPVRQDAQMLNSSTQGGFAILGNVANDFASGSVLVGKKLVGKHDRDHWQFTFKDVKPSADEQKALDDFGKRTDLLALWPYLYGAQPRRKGETWKADATAFTKDSKVPLNIDLNFTLSDIADHNGSRCANIKVAGLIRVPIGGNNASSLTLDVQGEIWRDVRDLVDVEVNLRGTLGFTGTPAKNPSIQEGTTVEISAPFTLTRSVKSAKK